MPIPRLTSLVCFVILLLSLSMDAQISTGQWMINGEVSFYNNHQTDERNASARTLSGESIPALNYDFQQYAHNLTLNPRLHYFLSEKWSVGAVLSFRQIITHRFIDEIILEEPSEYLALSVSTKAKNTTYSYAPKIEVGRHWNLNKRIAISLMGDFSWQWVTLKKENAALLELTKVTELNNWNVSNNGLTISPNDVAIETEKSGAQYWTAGLSPHIRWAITPRFGLSAAFGGISLSQKIKDDSPSFVKAKPSWAIQLNPGSWNFGIYGVFGGERMEE